MKLARWMALYWRPPLPSDPDELRVLKALWLYKQGSRQWIVKYTGLGDRRVRACIKSLREAGWPIASDSSQAGYRLTTDPAELERLEHDLRSRALSALRTLRLIRRARQRVAA